VRAWRTAQWHHKPDAGTGPQGAEMTVGSLARRGTVYRPAQATDAARQIDGLAADPT
jgi:hypothetical protein